MKVLTLLSTALAAVAFSLPVAAQDADAAQKLLKAENCTKCHSVDKSKKGPSYQKVSSKYKGKADAEASLVAELGDSKKHPPNKASPEDRATLVKWILSL